MATIKRICFMLFFVACTTAAFPQAFSELWTVPLPNTITSAKPEWGDMDNDGLLDIVLLVQDTNGQHFIWILKGDTVNIPPLNDALKFSVVPADRFYLTDFNADNSLDIIVPALDPSGDVKVFLNEGELSFQLTTQNIPSFSKMLFADLDNDAMPEWIISYKSQGADLVSTFRKTTAGNWLSVDTVAIKATTLETLDADGDGFRDLFVSGEVRPDSLFTGFLINQDDFKFKATNRIDGDASGSLGDINNDGFFDIILSGANSAGNNIQKVYKSSQGSYSVRDTTLNAITPAIFIADFNSDGAVDSNLWSKSVTGDSISIIQTTTAVYHTFDLHNVITERIGDADHDGDLDILQVKKSTTLNLVLHGNNAPRNHSPERPDEVIAFLFLDHIFITWLQPHDDHTPSSALTYDLYMEGVNEGDFDLITEKRLKVNHGNNGSRNFLLINQPEQSNLQFALQAVDNALHAGDPGSLCMGGIQTCDAMQLESITLCTKEERIFTAPENAAWYSFSSGYISSGTTLNYTADNSDVVFYFTPSNPDCAHLKAWQIEVKDTVRNESLTLYACEDEQIELTAESSWATVSWTSQQYGALGSARAVQYHVTNDDKVNALLSLGTGCRVDREFTIKVSKPEVQITAENTYVYAGRSLTLNASGADHYIWVAANGIDDVNSASPKVSPIETTEFIVNGYDSIGCVDQGSIRIVVERNGFIPSLFTPNNDGKNDYLRVYGILSAPEFSLEIFNRNGSMVYSATTLGELTSGWDGTTRGVKQPAGVYFWKVKGKLFSGEKIQFNGKDTGSIVLIR